MAFSIDGLAEAARCPSQVANFSRRRQDARRVSCGSLARIGFRRGNPFNVIGPAERNFLDCSRARAGHAHQHRTRSQAGPSGTADHLIVRVDAHNPSYAAARSHGIGAGRLDAVKCLRRSAARHARGSLASGVGGDGARVRAGARRGDLAAVGLLARTTAPGQPAARQARASPAWCAWRCGQTSPGSCSPRQAPSCSACRRATG